MRLNLAIVLTLAALLVGMTLDYAETRGNAKAGIALQPQVSKLKEDVTVLRSHLRSWSDEARRKK
jgi:hypothetical protein